MNLEEFNQKYKNYTQKQKINIKCDICGADREIVREKAIENITNNGYYRCPSCAMKDTHKTKPRGDATKEKQRQGRLGKKHTESSKQQMSESAAKKWNSPEGQEIKKKLSLATARQHALNKPDKSKRKVFYISAKNGGEVRTCLSSYEYIYCEDFLEKNESVVSYETQVFYQIEDRTRSLDFLVTYKDGTKEAIEIKPKKRLTEQSNIDQLQDSETHALSQGWSFEILTEHDLGISKCKEATARADTYRHKHYLIDYAKYRRAKSCERTMRYYRKNDEKVLVYCDFCKDYHEVRKKSYEANIEKNGDYICERKGGHIAGSKPKLHLRKENPYAELGQKKCNKCERVLPFEGFSPDKSKRDGYSTRCKECRAAVYKGKYQEKYHDKHT